MLIFLNPLSPFFYLFTAPFFVLCLAGIVLKSAYLLALEVSPRNPTAMPLSPARRPRPPIRPAPPSPLPV